MVENRVWVLVTCQWEVVRTKEKVDDIRRCSGEML